MTQRMKITIGAPVTGANFFPRNDVIAALNRGLEVEHILFLAPRRTGKTSLLKHLESNSSAGTKAVFINLERFTHPKQWIEQMAKALHRDSQFVQTMKNVGGWLSRIESESFKLAETDWTDAAGAFLEDLNRLDQSVLFLLDEFPIMINLFARNHGELTAEVKLLYERIVFSRRNTYSENMWKRLNDVFSTPLADAARTVLKLIADAPDGFAREDLKARAPAIEPEDFNYVLDVLVHDGYLSETLDGRYRFFSNLLRDYWRRKGRL